MNWIHELEQSESLQSTLTTFFNQYGFPGLENALHLYTNLQQKYICNSTITLINNAQLHMSQLYAPKVLIAFSRNNVSKSL